MRVLETSLIFTAEAYDIDAFGVVSNIVYVRWLEDLRMKLTRELIPVIDLIKEQLFSVIAETNIQYKRPMRFQEQALGKIWIEETLRARWRIGAELIHISNGNVICTAAQIGVFYNYGDGTVIQVPAALVEFVNSERKGMNYGT